MTPVFVIGDTHGEWDQLFIHVDNAGIEKCALLHVGDIGIGFKSREKQMKELVMVNNRFKKRDITFYGIRGNHDNPAYFNGDIKLSNLELLADYATKTFNGKKFLFVGGAVSVDRKNRVPELSWWENEAVVLRDHIETCDVLITHTTPSWNCPTDKTLTWFAVDDTLLDDCVKENKNLDKIIEQCQCRKHLCGHFHMSSFVSVNGCDSTILDICEIKEVLI